MMNTTKIAVQATALLLVTSIASEALAQNTGGVFGPIVREDHRSAQYRSAFDPDSDGFAQRLHYQESIGSDLMWRVVAQARKTASSDVDFDFVQGELFWHLSDDSSPWQTGFRFDVRLRDAGRPATIGVNWMNQFELPSQWHARFLVLGAIDVGDGANDGIALQTRTNLYRTVQAGYQVGLEMFSSYGTTSDFADLDEQRHSLGPFVSVPVGDSWSLFAGALFGLTSPTTDTDLRVWVTRKF